MERGSNKVQLELYPVGEERKVQANTERNPSENELTILALASIPGVGFVTVRALFDTFKGDLSKVWNASGDELYDCMRAARTPQPMPIIRRIEVDRKNLMDNAKNQFYFLRNRRQTSIIFKGTDEYPKQLENLDYPPVWLFVEGDKDILHHEKIVAVVGTRTPTEDGIEAAKRLSVNLIRSGCLILSGLAEGIDETGHRTAVDYGQPTIAVLGHGIDVIFPSSTAGLRREMIKCGGAVISEYLPGDSYLRERFVQRNRIQAALSHAVAVIEGQSKSGTAHTVRFSQKLNRPLFGVRLGDNTKHKNQELLLELEKQDNPVFNLNSSDGREKLRDFLQELFVLSDDSIQRVEPRLFGGLIKEIERVSKDYDATEDDFKWLILEIQKRSKSQNS